jgi:hypothetical protein
MFILLLPCWELNSEGKLRSQLPLPKTSLVIPLTSSYSSQHQQPLHYGARQRYFAKVNMALSIAVEQLPSYNTPQRSLN